MSIPAEMCLGTADSLILQLYPLLLCTATTWTQWCKIYEPLSIPWTMFYTAEIEMIMNSLLACFHSAHGLCVWARPRTLPAIWVMKGRILPHSSYFKHRFPQLTALLHSKGLKRGITGGKKSEAGGAQEANQCWKCFWAATEELVCIFLKLITNCLEVWPC